jgi:hypothetical protein
MAKLRLWEEAGRLRQSRTGSKCSAGKEGDNWLFTWAGGVD